MDKNIINQLKSGRIGVIPTDTIYGIVGSALNKRAVEKIYKIRKRSLDKPFIVLISSLEDLEKFDVSLTGNQRDFLEKNWPNPLSVVLPRDNNSLAFRMPNDKDLLEILKLTGPLVAPSANFEGEKPSETISEAKKYFRDNIDFYVDGGKIRSQPSTLIYLNVDGSYKILRKGSFVL